MHWAAPCISNLAKGESGAASKSRRLQMMARVRLDANHVSRCVTARREKVTRYLRVFQRTFKVRTFRLYSLRLRVLEHTVRENIARFLESSWVFALEVFGGSVTAAALFFCRFLRWIVTKDEGWSGAHVDPSLTRQVPTFWSTGRIRNIDQFLNAIIF